MHNISKTQKDDMVYNKMLDCRDTFPDLCSAATAGNLKQTVLCWALWVFQESLCVTNWTLTSDQLRHIIWFATMVFLKLKYEVVEHFVKPWVNRDGQLPDLGLLIKRSSEKSKF